VRADRTAVVVATVLPLLVACRMARGTPAHPVAPPQVSPAPGAESVAYGRFQQQVAQYIALRRAATAGVPALKPGADAATILTHQRAQAAAIRARRAGARAGDLFAPDVAPIIARVVRDELTKMPEEREKVTKENPRAETPGTPVTLKVDAEYPLEASLSTVPPGLLLRLPRLPEGLEYRFVGRHLVVRDVDANTIVDYLLNVVP
jgi:hypothetical protein